MALSILVASTRFVLIAAATKLDDVVWVILFALSLLAASTRFLLIAAVTELDGVSSHA